MRTSLGIMDHRSHIGDSDWQQVEKNFLNLIKIVKIFPTCCQSESNHNIPTPLRFKKLLGKKVAKKLLG